LEVGVFRKYLLQRRCFYDGGAFATGRYRRNCLAILDNEALLATCAYIDLNPVAAGIAELPEDSPYTSLHQRVEHCREKGRLADLQAARQGTVAAAKLAAELDEDHWLCPINDTRASGGERIGLLEGFSLGSYLQLVDWTSRLFREGKARVSDEVAPILDRLDTTGEMWQETMKRLFAKAGKTLGVAFTFHRDPLRQAAAHRGCHHLANLNGCRT